MLQCLCYLLYLCFFFFFFQAEDGIRDHCVTGVQTCALPISSAENVYTVLQGLEAAANLIVLMGAGVFFLFRIEERLKRRAALKALHELRSIVHVIDMHQLTKDPGSVVSIAGKTASSPARTLSRIEVARYLDYCSEMLSLTSKVAVLFAQGFPEPTVTEAVSDIERISAGLAQK